MYYPKVRSIVAGKEFVEGCVGQETWNMVLGKAAVIPSAEIVLSTVFSCIPDSQHG